MKVEQFMEDYVAALLTQDWGIVAPLIADSASVTFSDGTVHIGKDKVKLAFEHNFATIKSEQYAIEITKWLVKEATYAVYLFEFSWVGLINGQSHAGSGVGTGVLVCEDGQWKLLVEHMGRRQL